MKLRPTSRLSYFAATSFILISIPAQAVVLASYEFTGSNAAARAAATSSASDLTATSFSIRSELNTGTSLSGFSSGGNIFSRVSGTTASTLSEAITETQYVTVNITPDSGFQLNLTSLTVDLGYSLAGASVPGGLGKELNASVFSSVDGFSAADVLGASTTASTVDTTLETGGIFYQNLNIDLTGAAYQNLTGPLEFRIYLHDDHDADSQPIHRIDNFTLNGAVVPEPSIALLGSLSLLGLLRRRR